MPPPQVSFSVACSPPSSCSTLRSARRMSPAGALPLRSRGAAGVLASSLGARWREAVLAPLARRSLSMPLAMLNRLPAALERRDTLRRRVALRTSSNTCSRKRCAACSRSSWASLAVTKAARAAQCREPSTTRSTSSITPSSEAITTKASHARGVFKTSTSSAASSPCMMMASNSSTTDSDVQRPPRQPQNPACSWATSTDATAAATRSSMATRPSARRTCELWRAVEPPGEVSPSPVTSVSSDSMGGCCSANATPGLPFLVGEAGEPPPRFDSSPSGSAGATASSPPCLASAASPGACCDSASPERPARSRRPDTSLTSERAAVRKKKPCARALAASACLLAAVLEHIAMTDSRMTPMPTPSTRSGVVADPGWLPSTATASSAAAQHSVTPHHPMNSVATLTDEPHTSGAPRKNGENSTTTAACFMESSDARPALARRIGDAALSRREAPSSGTSPFSVGGAWDTTLLSSAVARWTRSSGPSAEPPAGCADCTASSSWRRSHASGRVPLGRGGGGGRRRGTVPGSSCRPKELLLPTPTAPPSLLASASASSWRPTVLRLSSSSSSSSPPTLEKDGRESRCSGPCSAGSWGSLPRLPNSAVLAGRGGGGGAAGPDRRATPRTTSRGAPEPSMPPRARGASAECVTRSPPLGCPVDAPAAACWRPTSKLPSRGVRVASVTSRRSVVSGAPSLLLGGVLLATTTPMACWVNACDVGVITEPESRCEKP
mmetsp:Transcript_8230/g.32444  ORF Transcript_8230/g.32444 Transcript_8230/m.32444 type:complete len:726 (+) Transcript_8230:1237-3414(+)